MALSWITVGCLHPIEWDDDEQTGTTETGEPEAGTAEITELCCKILNVPYGADQDTIKKAYRELTRKYHLDKNKGEDTKEIIQVVNEAYEILGKGNTTGLTGHESSKPATIKKLGSGLQKIQALRGKGQRRQNRGSGATNTAFQAAGAGQGVASEHGPGEDGIGEID